MSFQKSKSNYFALVAMISSIAITQNLYANSLQVAVSNKSQKPAPLSPCEKDTKFPQWLEGVKKEALAQGVSVETWSQVKKYLVLDPKILARDRQQGVFQQPFLQFSDRMVSNARIKKAIQLITSTHKELFEKIENDFGVPPQPIAALWALESDFGAFTGKYSIITATATLAYDCRRPDMFRNHLIHALLLAERGDLLPEEMIGNWAGELGGAQFMPEDYFESGIDYDNDGKVNLITSIPDTLATIANYFIKHGWKRNEPWMQEVSLPNELPWDKADPDITLPLTQWKSFGVKPIKGTFPKENFETSLVIPMGKNGPAFITYPNMNIFRKWNSSFVYSTTAAYLATRIAGANKVLKGKAEVIPLTTDEVIEMQKIFLTLNFDIGEADGKMGTLTRQAVKQMQFKLKMSADSYPTQEFLEKLRNYVN